MKKVRFINTSAIFVSIIFVALIFLISCGGSGGNGGGVGVADKTSLTTGLTAGYAASSLVYVANQVDSTVSVVDIETGNIIATIPVGVRPNAIAITQDGLFAFVGNRGSNNISVIDTSSNTVVGTIPVGVEPVGIVLSPSGKILYCVNYYGGYVSIVDIASKSEIGQIPIAGTPGAIAISPDGSRLYVSEGEQGVTVVDTATNTIITNISVYYPFRMCVNPAGTRFYVSQIFSDAVGIFDTANNQPIDTISVGSYPTNVKLSMDGMRLYVANHAGNTISVVDTTTNQVITTIPVGDHPDALSVDMVNSYLYVTNVYSNNISVIDTITNTVVKTISVGTEPRGIAVKNVLQKSLQVIEPNGGEILYKGTDYRIKWTWQNYTGNIRIHMYKDDAYYATIAADVFVASGTEGIIFNPPSTWISSDKYKIVMSTIDNVASDQSDNYFSIRNPINELWAHPVWPYGPYYNGRTFFPDMDHLGEDIDKPEKTAIRAIGPGIIRVYRSATGYGELAVVIEHDLGKEYQFTNAYGNTITTRYIMSIYGHLRSSEEQKGKSLDLRVGSKVTRDTIIGFVNNSSHPDGLNKDPNGDGLEHLHIGIRLSDYVTATKNDPTAPFRGYERGTDFGKDFAAASKVIEILRNTP